MFRKTLSQVRFAFALMALFLLPTASHGQQLSPAVVETDLATRGSVKATQDSRENDGALSQIEQLRTQVEQLRVLVEQQQKILIELQKRLTEERGKSVATNEAETSSLIADSRTIRPVDATDSSAERPATNLITISSA